MEKEIDPVRMEEINLKAPSIAEKLSISVHDAITRVLDFLPRYPTKRQVMDALKWVKNGQVKEQEDERNL